MILFAAQMFPSCNDSFHNSMWQVLLQGEVLIKGRKRHGLLSDDPEIGKLLTVGMVFQNGALFDSLTVGQNVGFLLYEHTALPSKKIQVPSLTMDQIPLQFSMILLRFES